MRSEALAWQISNTGNLRPLVMGSQEIILDEMRIFCFLILSLKQCPLRPGPRLPLARAVSCLPSSGVWNR
jgi:hypothetical protein